MDTTQFPELIRSIYRIVDELESMFPGRHFTPDGHMVGSIGEAIAKHYYGVKLHSASYKGHDGEAAGFRVQVSDADGIDNDSNGLSKLAFDPQATAYGLANSGVAAKYGQDARARINGLEVTSATNTFTDNVPGVTIKVVTTTTSSATMTIMNTISPGRYG